MAAASASASDWHESLGHVCAIALRIGRDRQASTETEGTETEEAGSAVRRPTERSTVEFNAASYEGEGEGKVSGRPTDVTLTT